MAKKNSYGKAHNEDERNDNIIPENRDASGNLAPMSDEQKQNSKRKLKDVIANQHKEKLSRQKKKRLDKYIEHQLKREEKAILFKKLEETRIDSSILKSAKLIGTGRQTKREEFVEALHLEKQGRGDDRTKDILYEERTVKNWDDSSDEEFKDYRENLKQKPVEEKNDDASDDEDETHPSTQSEGFIDYRPTQGLSMGFGFQNLVKKEKKTKPSKSYSWRAKVEIQDEKRKNEEDEMDFEYSSDDEEEEIEDSEAEDDDDDDDEEDEEEEEDAESEDEETQNKVEENGKDDEDAEDDKDDEDDEEESEEESEEEEVEEAFSDFKPKHSEKAQGFKEWAEAQVRKMEGREEFVAPTAPQMEYQPVIRSEDLESEIKEDYIPINEKLSRKIFTVDVIRSDEIQKSRMALPVFSEEHRIMEAIHHNDCVIICGETGSGKTTQVPQFLFESGYGNENSETPGLIGVTQPRRVAAVSMADRVGKELGNHANKVGYQIRFDTKTGKETALKFMTDGVLLREMMTDFMLQKYSALIIDEAHERNVNTDILIGMLSRILKLRRQYFEKDPKKYKPLKLIIMSATLRVSDFSENKTLFDTPPPILKVEARQYPVSIHFNRRTAFNYTEEAFRKTCKIHRRLPKGGILVFLTGKNEITDMVKKLRKTFPFADTQETKKNKKIREFKRQDKIESIKVSAKNADIEPEEIDFEVEEMEDDFDDEIPENESDEEGEEEGFEETLDEDQNENDPLYVLPLYSLLPTKEQMKIFQDPPAGSRLCVIATNVAETSLTIPGIRYVVDCGRSKERKFKETTGVQSFEIDWISKASADQRSGRAGRTGPGHCYRLFSSAVYESDFPQFSKPEILRMPVESVVLSMKSIGIDNIVNFPFPTPPDRVMLSAAESLLQHLGALNENHTVTDLGKKMSLFPLSPRFSKMLIIGNQHECLPYVIALVSGLSVGEPFLTEAELNLVSSSTQKKKTVKRSDDSDDDEEDDDEEQEEQMTQKELEEQRQMRSKFNRSRKLFSRLDKYSDALRLLSAICAADHIPKTQREAFFRDHFMRSKIMDEIAKLRKQLTYIVNVNTKKENIAVSDNVSDDDLKLQKPSKVQVAAIKQMITIGFIDQIAIRADLVSRDVSISNKSTIISVPYATLFPSATKANEDNTDGFVYIHPSSIITNCGELPPPYLVYQSLNLSSNRTEGKLTKLRMKVLNDVGAKPLANVAKGSGLITYSKPLGHPYAPKDISPTERECYVIPRFGATIGTGGIGWDLPAIKVIQKKEFGNWIVKE